MTPTPDQTPEKMSARISFLEAAIDCSIQQTKDENEFARKLTHKLTTLRATNATMAERVRRLEEALTQIVNWGPFPDTGEFWPDGTKVSYGSQYGTNGEICYMVNVAKAALSPTPGAAVGKEGE